MVRMTVLWILKNGIYLSLLVYFSREIKRKELPKNTMAGLNVKDLENLDKQTLITLLAASMEANNNLQKSVDQLNNTVALLTEEVHNLRQHRFGRSSEKNLTETEGQLCLSFNEAEVTIDLDPNPKEPALEEVVVKTHTRSIKRKGKREEELKDIPVRIEEHTLSEDDLRKAFPNGKWSRLPDKVYKRLEFHPAFFEVVEHHIAVYAGGKAGGVVSADRPVDLLTNSIATASLVSGIYNFKYVNSMPINRMAQEFERNGVSIPTQTLCRWVILCADRYLKRLYTRMKGELLKYHVVHADETPVKVNRDGRPASSNSYMWVYRSGALEPHPFVLYEYQKTRKADHPKEFLKNFHGYCVTDGYQVYHTIDNERDDLKVAGCWAHARRGFADVVKSLPKDQQKNTVAYKALQIIQSMSRYEKSYADLPAQERLELRKKRIAPLVDAFFAYLKSESLKIAPKSGTGKAITYCLNQEKYLRVFLEDGLVPMWNNAAERSIRTFCLGKKNWYLIDTVSGAQASAIAYSIAETAKANNLKPYDYFKYLLEEFPKHGEFETDFLDDLLPWSDKLPDECRKQIQSEKI